MKLIWGGTPPTVSFTNKEVGGESNMNFMSDREREREWSMKEIWIFWHCCTCVNYGQVSKWPSYSQCMQEFVNDFIEKSLKKKKKTVEAFKPY